MACCGPSKNIADPDLMKKLRKNEEIIKMNLNQLKLSFDPKDCKWECNIFF